MPIDDSLARRRTFLRLARLSAPAAGAILLTGASLVLAPGCAGEDTSPGSGGSGPSSGSESSTGTASSQGGGGHGGAAEGGGGAGQGGMNQGGSGGQGGDGGDAGSGGSGGSGEGGSGGGGQGGSGGGTGDASTQIAAVRAAANGSGLNLPVHGALVTYTKPVLGQDVAGFFVQAAQSGPAIFVAIDPSLSPAVAIGDAVNFTVKAVATQNGVKQITAITGLSVVSSDEPIDPLVADVSSAANLVSALGTYESRAIRLRGTLGKFVSAGSPQVAAPIVTAGLNSPDLRLRMPEAVQAQLDLVEGCAVTLDYGVMWRFNNIAQPSAVRAEDLSEITCPAPTVLSATAISSTEVRVKFSRALDAATVEATDFEFDEDLTATAVLVAGAEVTITTTAQTAGLDYTVTVSGVKDALGTSIGMPNSATFKGHEAVAQLVFNELSPNISSDHDLIELLVTAAGSTQGITLVEQGTAPGPVLTSKVLAKLPSVVVAAGDLIVVHLTPATAAGKAPGSETTGKSQYAKASYSANYDTAWDFHGEVAGLTYSARVLRALGPADETIDAVAVSSANSPQANFWYSLKTLQEEGRWFPADCGGMPCVTNASALPLTVSYASVGDTASGNSVARKLGANAMKKDDWHAAGAQSFGLPNP